MTEASDIVLYGLAFFGVAFLPLFLWHLWLAPYRVMNERLNEIADRRDTPQEVDKEQTEEEAFRDLAPQIRDARDKFVVMNELTNSFFENRSAVNAVVADIGTRLKRLGIPTPEVKASDSIETVLKWWTAYLSILTPLADVGDIQNARAITFAEGVVHAPISSAGQGNKAEER